jgi:uncharacterized protein (UPF0548 family)
VRRRAHEPGPLNYAPVGGTSAPDLLGNPPRGYRSSEHRGRIGAGDECFRRAVTSLLTWGVQRGSGLRVTDIRSGTAAPSGIVGDDGTPALTLGTSIVLLMPLGPFALRAPARVVSVTEEPDRVGFAYGTLTGNPISGEESFVVERTGTGEVWFTLRQFSRPGRWYSRVASPALRVAQRLGAAHYLRVLRAAASG